MKTIFSLLFLSLFFLNCFSQKNKYQTQYFVVSTFLNNVKNNDTLSIKKMIGLKLTDFGKNDEILHFEIENLHKLIKAYGVPDEKSYKITEFSATDARLINILIPIGEDSLEISFVKYLPINKISSYYIYRHPNNENTIILPPN